MIPHNTEICVLRDAPTLTQAAAEQVVQHAASAVNSRGKFTVALAGGSSEKSLYTLLASTKFCSRLEWGRIEFYWGDERHVAPDHDESNYRMAYEAMLRPLKIPDVQIHRMEGELPSPLEAASRYESLLRNQLGNSKSPIPKMDLVLLGMGLDGHTASLFPGTEAVHETTKLVVAPWVEKFQAFRITMSPGLINNARQVIFLVSGMEKADVVRAVLEGPFQPDELPSQVINPISGQLTWLIDQKAANALSSRKLRYIE